MIPLWSSPRHTVSHAQRSTLPFYLCPLSGSRPCICTELLRVPHAHIIICRKHLQPSPDVFPDVSISGCLILPVRSYLLVVSSVILFVMSGIKAVCIYRPKMLSLFHGFIPSYPCSLLSCSYPSNSPLLFLPLPPLSGSQGTPEASEGLCIRIL